MSTRLAMRRVAALLLAATSAFLTPSRVTAYITSPGALPAHRQLPWLQQLTHELVDSQTPLSQHQLDQAPQLLQAWSHTPARQRRRRRRRQQQPSNANNNITDHVLQMEHIMARMIQEGAPVTVQEYNCLLLGWTRVAGDDGDVVPAAAAAERGEQILTQMQKDVSIRPNLSSFQAVLMAWREAAASTHGSMGPYRAQRILEWMLQLYDSGQNEQALPDSDCFDIVLQTWSRSRNPAAPTQTERWIAVMEQLSARTGMAHVQPSVTTFNACLAAWARHDPPRPPTNNDNDDFFARQKAARMCDILNFMEQSSRAQVVPDKASYAMVLSALSQVATTTYSGWAARMADQVLAQVERAAQRGALQNPETILFNTAMGCWAKSNVSGAFRKARSILDRQIHLHERYGHDACVPDVVGYTSVMATCAAEKNPGEQLKAFNVAVSTYRDLQKGGGYGHVAPNHVTYATALKTTRLLPPHWRRKWVQRFFDDAARAGHVSDLVLVRLQNVASAQQYGQLLQGYTAQTLPETWTANVQDNSIKRNRTKPVRRRRPWCRRRGEV